MKFFFIIISLSFSNCYLGICEDSFSDYDFIDEIHGGLLSGSKIETKEGITYTKKSKKKFNGKLRYDEESRKGFDTYVNGLKHGLSLTFSIESETLLNEKNYKEGELKI